MLKNILIIGGSSGLGLELAKMYTALGHTVIITGRTDPKIENLQFIFFTVSDDSKEVVAQIDTLVAALPPINTLIYAAGFYQSGRIDSASDKQMLEMINLNVTVPALLVNRLKNNPNKPLKVMLITSSSQYTPRELEPMYTATKAALGMFGNSLGLDSEIGKVLVVAPSGMKTPFWRKDMDKDVSGFLDPQWVAEQIIELSSGPFKYKYAKILKGPERVEIVEIRNTA